MEQIVVERDELRPWSAVEQLVRTLRVRADDPVDLVGRMCAEACRMVPATRDAGVILTGPGRSLEPVHATGQVPERLDRQQQQAGRGPCLTAARKQIVVRMHDIAADTRWDGFRAAALDAGVASMLCVPLYVDDEVLGTLSLYGGSPNAFREGAEPIARVLAALAAVALAESRQTSRLEQALQNRDLIGQAKGILMHGHGIRADEAFEMLRTHSQRTNSKLLVVAEKVIETGALP